MAGTVGFTMHESGFWFKNSDSTGPYVYDGNNMVLLSVADIITGGMGGILASSGIKANQVAVATLPAASNKRNYVTGFDITGSGSTLGSVVTATLSGLVGGDVDYVVACPSGVLAAVIPVVVEFRPPIPAAAEGQAVTLTLPALGVGSQKVSVILHGYLN